MYSNESGYKMIAVSPRKHVVPGGTELTPKKKPKRRCDLDGCKQKIGFDPIICSICKNAFCDKHRLQFQHNCDRETLKQSHQNMIKLNNPITKADKMRDRI